MKTFTFFILLNIVHPPANWLHNFEDAKAKAAQDHKYVLLNFSGSDWCSHCMELEKEIFGTATFIDYANKNLVLVKADFPRKKKHKLDADQVKYNDALAEKYNKKGVFPVTLLFDEKGNLLKEWEGSPDETPEGFINQLKAIIDHK